jgi:hypothetical protein
MAMAYKNKKLYVIGGILDRGEPIIEDEKEEGSIGSIYGKLIEVINVENVGEDSSVFEITSELCNGICMCPAIIRADQAIIILKDMLMEPDVSDSQYTQSIYSIRLDAASKKAMAVCEKIDDGLAPYYGYEATDCIETMGGHLIIPKFNESTKQTIGMVIEYYSKENTFAVYSFNAHNQ